MENEPKRVTWGLWDTLHSVDQLPGSTLDDLHAYVGGHRHTLTQRLRIAQSYGWLHGGHDVGWTVTARGRQIVAVLGDWWAQHPPSSERAMRRVPPVPPPEAVHYRPGVAGITACGVTCEDSTQAVVTVRGVTCAECLDSSAYGRHLLEVRRARPTTGGHWPRTGGA